MFYKTKENKVFQVVKSGPWQAVVPVEVTEAAEPAHRWSGKRIKIEQVQQATAFFEWALKDNPKDEALVHFYYNDTGEWKVIAPLQHCQGLSVEAAGIKKESVYYDRQQAILAEHVPSNHWVLAGSLHHHVNIGAFQSGTDSTDEAKYFGVHLTLGHMDQPTYDLHARVSFKGVFTKAYLVDWFEVEGADQYPAHIADEMIAYHLKRHAPEGTTFPEWWKESIVKSVRTYEPIVYGLGNWVPSPNSGQVSHSVSAPVEKKRKAFFKLEDDLETLVTDYNCSGKDIATHVQGVLDENPVIEDLINIIADHDTTAEESLALLTVMSDKNCSWKCSMCKETIYDETQSSDELCEDCRDFYTADRFNDL